MCDALQNLRHHLVPIDTLEMVLPPGVALEARFVLLESRFPVGKPFHRNGRSIVGPMLEKGPVLFQRMNELLLLECIHPGVQGQVMGPFYDVDGVHLHESQTPDEVGKRGLGGAPFRVVQQALGAHEKTAGGISRDHHRVHG